MFLAFFVILLFIHGLQKSSRSFMVFVLSCCGYTIKSSDSSWTTTWLPFRDRLDTSTTWNPSNGIRSVISLWFWKHLHEIKIRGCDVWWRSSEWKRCYRIEALSLPRRKKQWVTDIWNAINHKQHADVPWHTSRWHFAVDRIGHVCCHVGVLHFHFDKNWEYHVKLGLYQVEEWQKCIGKMKN